MPEAETAPSWRTERARTAAHTRHGNTAAAEAARQRLKAACAEDYIRRLVDEAPALTLEARDRLAVLLRGGAVA